MPCFDTMEAIILFMLMMGASAYKYVPRIPRIGDTLTVNRLGVSEDAHRPLSPLIITNETLQLKRAGGAWSMSSVYLQALRRQQHAGRAINGSSPLISIQAGTVFLAPVTVGNQRFDVVVDTGSSDPWLAADGFQCIDPNTDESQDQSACFFGPTYNPSQSQTYHVYPNTNFNISYADGEYLSGPMGYESFTLGGITVPQQEFGLVNRAAWFGDGFSSGLVGFAYSSLTSAYAGTDSTQDAPSKRRPYNTLFQNMYLNQGVAPIFSLAISRDPNEGGVLALGGIPDVDHSPSFTSTRLLPVGINATSGSLLYQFYSINLGGFAYSKDQNAQFNTRSTTNATPNPKKATVVANNTSAIVDSGTTLVYTPDSVAAGVAAAFSPPAQYDPDSAMYFVDCDATPPLFGATISDKIFYVNPLDMVLQVSESTCISGVQPNLGGLTILGDVWMKNVLAVFDIGASQMRFAAREFSALSSSR